MWRRTAVRSFFLTQVTDLIGHPLPEALTGVEIAGTHHLVGNTTYRAAGRSKLPSFYQGGWVSRFNSEGLEIVPDRCGLLRPDERRSVVGKDPTVYR